MNPDKIRTALNTIAVGLGELSEALTDQYEARYVGPGDEPEVQWNSAERAAAEAFQGVADYVNKPQGHEAICPKHHVPYTDGQYGPYCKEITDDPAWGKQKGDRLWCRITPKNAAEYLRIKAAA